MPKQFVELNLTINGESFCETVDARASLADVLRKQFSLYSVKKGCEVGECGACNVLIDGKSYNACIYLAIWAEGKNIETVEGLQDAEGNLSDIQTAFMEEAAVQCGFCTPGLIMRAVEILNREKLYTREELRKLLSGHMCRCTGYENILNAVEKTMQNRCVQLKKERIIRK